eukprot:COSAG01_NODE_452_length_16879_cov_474.367223_14_plen_69_part_00
MELSAEGAGDVHDFREFVVMHGDYVYPEYVVAYQRQDGLAAPQDQPEVEPQPQPELAEGVPPGGSRPL